MLTAITNNLDKAVKPGESIRDYSSTLLLAVVKGEEFIAGHLRGGLVGCLGDQGCSVLSAPDNVEFCNVTYFTAHCDAVTHLRIVKGELKERKGFALMSDGTAESLFHKKDRRFAPALTRMFNWFEHYSAHRIGQALEANL